MLKFQTFQLLLFVLANTKGVHALGSVHKAQESSDRGLAPWISMTCHKCSTMHSKGIDED
jgi:hypothetical protein